MKDFITSLPDGYNTIIGDGGGTLSGGQKQRIALARALVRKPDILIMDEATSALDNETEKFVHKAITSLKDKITIILIAHRFSTVRDADVIYVLDQGRIVESGTYPELQQKDGFFSQLQNASITVS